MVAQFYLDMAKEMIEGAARAGCDAVKFQKRTPELCVPRDQWQLERETPWGRMAYIDYRYKVEFGWHEYAESDRFCRKRGILWFASCWDDPSVRSIEQFDPPMYKAASASLTGNQSGKITWTAPGAKATTRRNLPSEICADMWLTPI